MSGSVLKFIIFASCLVLAATTAPAAVITEDFEAFSDLGFLSNQVPGGIFSNATVLSAGQSINEFEFPPRSGLNVVIDDSGELVIDFTSPVYEVGAYFTYLTQLTFSAYDAGLNLVATDVSDFLTNLALSGEPGSAPNEFLGVSVAGGISRVVISGDPAGFSFVMDDMTVSTSQVVVTVPEPQTVSLLLAALGAVALIRRRSWPGSLIRVRQQAARNEQTDIRAAGAAG